MTEDEAVSFDSDIEKTIVEGVAAEMDKQDESLYPAFIHLTLPDGCNVRYSAPTLSDFDGKTFVITDKNGETLLDLSFSERVK